MQPAASPDVDGIVERLSLGAREAARVLARASSAAKDRALRDAASGLRGAQVRVPIGVVLTIYESRPNVTADSAALCLKTANAVLLKGGSESQATSGAIATVIRSAIGAAGLPVDAVQPVEGGREVVRGLLRRDH